MIRRSHSACHALVLLALALPALAVEPEGSGGELPFTVLKDFPRHSTGDERAATARLLQSLLNAGDRSIRTPNGTVTARATAERFLAFLSRPERSRDDKAMLDEYRRIDGPDAAKALKKALETKELAWALQAYRRFRFTEEGLVAGDLAAALHLDRGHFDMAALLYGDLLSRSADFPEQCRPLMLVKTAYAFARMGRQTEAKQVWKTLEGTLKGKRLTLANGNKIALDDPGLRKEVLEAPPKGKDSISEPYLYDHLDRLDSPDGGVSAAALEALRAVGRHNLADIERLLVASPRAEDEVRLRQVRGALARLERGCTSTPKPVVHAAFTGKGERLFTLDDTRGFAFRNPSTGEATARRMPGGKFYQHPALSSDGKTLFAFEDGLPALVDTASGKTTRLKAWKGESAKVGTISPDGKQAACWGSDRKLWLWDTAEKDTPPEKIPLGVDRDGEVWSLVYAADGKRLFYTDFAGDLYTLDLETKKVSKTPAGLYGASLVLSRDGRRLVVTGLATEDRKAVVYDVGTMKPIQEFAFRKEQQFSGVAISPDGESVAFGDLNGRVRLFDTATGKILRELEGGHKETVRALAFSPDGATLVSGGLDHRLCLWAIAPPKAPEGGPRIYLEALRRRIADSGQLQQRGHGR